MATKLIWVHRKGVEEVNGEMGFQEVSAELAEVLIAEGVAQDSSDPAEGELIYLEGEEPEGYVIPSPITKAKAEATGEAIGEATGEDETTVEDDDLDNLLGVDASAEEQATGAQ